MLLHLSIDYTEGDPQSYRGIVISNEHMELRRWMTGDPAADWAAWMAWAQEEKPLALCSSSISQFLFDVPGWRMIEDENGREVLVPEDPPEGLVDTAVKSADQA